MPGLKRLNLGCGEKPLDGYENWDRKTGQEAFPLAVEDGSCSEIRACHLLEHFSYWKIPEILKDWYRALEPGGILRLSVPDFRRIAKMYIDGYPGVPYQSYIMGSQSDDNDYHKAIMDGNRLCHLLCVAGFSNITPMPSDADDCSKLPISLNLQAEKPWKDGIDKVENTILLLASARFGPIFHHRAIEGAIHKLGIPTATEISCFWHSTQCKLLQRACDMPQFKYAITDDFDSIFTESDILTLYTMMEAFPEVDAIAPLQAKRGLQNVPLYSLRDNLQSWQAVPSSPSMFRDAPLVKVDTAHFGLTIIRLDKLRKLPKPWMLHIPGADGQYDSPGGIDADIYFWKQWKEAGNNLYISPRVTIGHVEEVVVWPDKDCNKTYQVFQDYIDNGIPREVVRV